MANTAATTFTKVTKRMLEEIPPTHSRPTLNIEPPVRIPSIELHGFKRIMTSPIVLNTTSQIVNPTTFSQLELNQNNATDLDSTGNSVDLQETTRSINPWVIFGFIAIVIVGVAMLVSTISFCLKARKKALTAKREWDEEEADEVTKMRLAGLRHVRVELKDMGEIMRPERAV